MSEWAAKQAQWLVPSGFHDLHNGHVDFEQWFGQVGPRRPIHCAL
jgi:hypothetical protein